MNNTILTQHFKLIKLLLAAMFIAIGIVLPFLTGQIQQIGNLLLPMHLSVFLCGLICGWKYGLAVGVILPVLRSFLFGMPVLFPNAAAMAVELAVYGLVAGMIYGKLKQKTVLSTYIAMLPAMVLGRIAWGIVQIILLGIQNNAFTWQMYIAGAFLNAIPGIILQLILIPTVMSTLYYTGVLKAIEQTGNEKRR